MKYYKLRLDIKEKNDAIVLHNKYADRYLISFEDQDTGNPHCHSYFSTLSKPAAIRAYIRKHIGGGNGSYSMKELDEQTPMEYLAYCVKQGDYIHNLDNEIITAALAYDAKVKKEIKEKKKSRKTILEQMEEEFQYQEGEVYADQVITDVIQFYKNKGTLVREFAMVSQVQTLLLKYDPEYATTLSTNIHKAIDKTRL